MDLLNLIVLRSEITLGAGGNRRNNSPQVPCYNTIHTANRKSILSERVRHRPSSSCAAMSVHSYCALEVNYRVLEHCKPTTKDGESLHHFMWLCTLCEHNLMARLHGRFDAIPGKRCCIEIGCGRDVGFRVQVSVLPRTSRHHRNFSSPTNQHTQLTIIHNSL